MVSKRHILIFVDWYVPGYKAGGPIRSVSNMVKALEDDFEFSIVTSNCDAGESEPYANIEPNKWLDVGGARVQYLSAEKANKATLKKIITDTEAEVVYFNSFFSFRFTLTPLLLVKRFRRDLKVVVAPRGMLATGALQIKATKKRIFIAVAKLARWYDGVTWHASTALEEQEIRAVFGESVRVVMAENIALLDEGDIHASRPAKLPGTARFFFVSRIAIKKNLLAAIRGMGAIERAEQVQFEIYGPVDAAEYWEECRAAIKEVHGVRIPYAGVLPHDEIGPMERGQHFFVLPTLNENYGHVVVEALANGCPVILSDQTPWQDLQAKGVGWDIPLDDQAQWTAVLQRCVDMDADEYRRMSERAAAFGRQVVGNEETTQRNRELFLNL